MEKETPFVAPPGYWKGYFGCSCHGWDTWEECVKAHRRKFKVGQTVKRRCNMGEFPNGEGVVIEINEDNTGFYIVKYGPLRRDEHLEHAAGIEPIDQQKQLSLF